jgi:hypothetical protein
MSIDQVPADVASLPNSRLRLKRPLRIADDLPRSIHVIDIRDLGTPSVPAHCFAV